MAIFFARQIKTRRKLLQLRKRPFEWEETPQKDRKYVPTSYDDYTDEVLKE